MYAYEGHQQKTGLPRANSFGRCGVEQFSVQLRTVKLRVSPQLGPMLPMFNGADVIFRNVLVPLAGQREALLLKDAKGLARTMVKQLPASRHGEAGEAVAQAFLDEAKKQGV